MKYFGKKSLSSVMSTIIFAAKIICFTLACIAPIAGSVVIFISTPYGEKVIEQQIRQHTCTDQSKPDAATSATLCNPSASGLKAHMNSTDFSGKDKKDWEKFKKLPLFVKILMLPYVEAVLILLIAILNRSRLLFNNFKNNIVFNRDNVRIISKISTLNIWFSILTVSFSSLLVSLFLFMLCEIIKNGAVLQEEHDLTV